MLAELGHNILLSLTALHATILVILLRIGSSIPYVKERIQKFEERNLLVPYQNFWDEYGGKKMLGCVLKIMLGDVNKTARLGNLAPNCRLISTDGKECRLLDFAKGTRPLVLNFGSCSWPPFFINFLNNFAKVVHDYDDEVDFLTVYILEAHPTDGWRWNNNVEIPQHQSLEDRLAAAEMLKKSSRCSVPIMVDAFENEASKAYGAWPERLFIIQDGKIVYEGGTGPYNYKITEVQSWLEKYKTRL